MRRWKNGADFPGKTGGFECGINGALAQALFLEKPFARLPHLEGCIWRSRFTFFSVHRIRPLDGPAAPRAVSSRVSRLFNREAVRLSLAGQKLVCHPLV